MKVKLLLSSLLLGGVVGVYGATPMEVRNDRVREAESNRREESLRYSDRANQNDQNALHDYNDYQIAFLRKLKADPYLSAQLPDARDREKLQKVEAGRAAAAKRFLEDYQGYVNSLKENGFNNTVKTNLESNYGILDRVLNDLEHSRVSDITIIFQEFSVPGSQVKYVKICDFSIK